MDRDHTMDHLTHQDALGHARMVDVGRKTMSRRVAVGSARIRVRPEIIRRMAAGEIPKGDVVGAARLAGIMAAKRTAELIPLCHPLTLESVSIDFRFKDRVITIRAEVAATGKTGVEMEAMTAASVAALTIYDMVKGADRGLVIEAIQLEEKHGGQSGHYVRSRAGAGKTDRRYVVLTVSDRSFRGERPDTSGPLVAGLLTKALGVAPVEVRVVCDDEPMIRETLQDLCDRAGCALVVTTGGTGLSPRDVTPDATRAIITRELPGLAEAMRAAGLRNTPFACLSRGVCGQRGGTIIINLSGHPTAAREQLSVLLPVLPHAIDIAGGSVAECMP